MASSLERTFETLWHLMAGPAYVREYEALPPRRWRLDAAWPDIKVGVELDGGVWKEAPLFTAAGGPTDLMWQLLAEAERADKPVPQISDSEKLSRLWAAHPELHS